MILFMNEMISYYVLFHIFIGKLVSLFCQMRQREVTLRDTRNLSASLKTISVDSSTG